MINRDLNLQAKEESFEKEEVATNSMISSIHMNEIGFEITQNIPDESLQKAERLRIQSEQMQQFIKQKRHYGRNS